MKKETIDITISGGRTEYDFNGFEGDACGKEEDKIRLFLGMMGVETNVLHSDNKRERESETVTERERVRA